MRMIYVVCLSLLLSSCFNNNSEKEEIDRLNQRITLLEQKIDALTNGSNSNPIRLNSMSNPSSDSYSTPRQSGSCQAITKKGTPCKRKAKYNGYCWQHGG